MNKIVELLIDWDNLEFDDLGVSIMSLVSDPAIGIAWQKFAAQKFVDVKPGETEEEYVSRCIPVLIGEGFEEDQAAAICYGSFEKEEKMETATITEDHIDKIEELIKKSDFGRTFDPKTTSYVNISKDEFATEAEVIQGIGALNDLLRSDDTDDNSKFLFKYDQGRSLPSGSKSRRFCQILMRANKYFIKEEIDEMSNEPLQPGMGPDSANFYDILKYKGGVACRHRWLQYRQYESNGRTVITELGPATINEEAGQIASKDGNNWWRMSKSSEWHFSEDEKMQVTGPAMVPNMMIPRYDKDGNMFHVYFSKETVEKIAQKFLEENNQHNTDINHDDNISTENTLLESWIVDDPAMDKATALGFNVPKSTWMVTYKINNEETWKQIKEGKLSGFSITGQFIESNIKY